MSEPAWLAADLGAASDLSPASRGERMRHSPQNNHGKEEDGKDRCWMSIVYLWLRFPAGSFDRLASSFANLATEQNTPLSWLPG